MGADEGDTLRPMRLRFAQFCIHVARCNKNKMVVTCGNAVLPRGETECGLYDIL